MIINQKHHAVAQAVVVFLLVIILVGSIYIPMNYAFQNYQTIQQQQWANNVFDADTLSFVNLYWMWFPAFVFMISFGYLYLKSQKRGYGE